MHARIIESVVMALMAYLERKVLGAAELINGIENQYGINELCIL